MNVFKKLEINIPFAEEMPHYIKFLKDIIIKNRNLDEGGVVSLSATVVSLFRRTYHRKCKT